MFYKMMLCVLLALRFASPLYAQRLPVKYLKAQDVVDMAKSSGKPYLWFTIYVPKCARASDLFSERVAYYDTKKDKVDLVMVSILSSNDNIDSVVKFSKSFHFDTPFYVMDTMYTKGNIRDTPVKFLKELNEALGAKYEFSQHIIIDKKGRLVYHSEDNIDIPRLDSLLK